MDPNTVTDYRVNLEIFAGPMDLLLYLVRKEEVDIYDIPIALVTVQYIEYVELLKHLDIEIAGDFLVMAATLMEIKSAMLLPRAEPESGEADDPTDPRSELVRQLLEYKRFKDAANLLNAAADDQGGRMGRPNHQLSKISPEIQTDVDIEQVSIWDLLDAFNAICRATGQHMDVRNIKDDTPIDLYQIEILHRLQNDGPLTFHRLFEGRPNRLIMVGRFLATLELVRNKLVSVDQADNGDLYLRSLTKEAADLAVQRSILAVEADEEPKETSLPIPVQEIPAKKKPSQTPVLEESPPPEDHRI